MDQVTSDRQNMSPGFLMEMADAYFGDTALKVPVFLRRRGGIAEWTLVKINACAGRDEDKIFCFQNPWGPQRRPGISMAVQGTSKVLAQA